MKAGDLVVIDPYWRSRSGWALNNSDPTGRAGKKGVVLGFTVNSWGMNKVVVHLFDERRDWFYYSPQHIRRSKEIPRYTPRKPSERDNIPQWVEDESW